MNEYPGEVILEREAKKFGRSSHVVLPVGCIGQRVRVVIPQRMNLKQGILEQLLPYTEHITGVYLTGSYARGEQTKDSDIDVLVATDEPLKIKSRGGYHITSLTTHQIIQAVKKDPLSLCPMISEARPIVNRDFLEQLKEEKVKIRAKWYLETTRSALDVVKGFLALEKEEGRRKLGATSCIYSLFLRLRLLYLIDCLRKNKRYSNKDFLASIKGIEAGKLKEMYRVYRLIRDEKSVGEHKILLKDAEKLYHLTEKWLKEKEGWSVA